MIFRFFRGLVVPICSVCLGFIFFFSLKMDVHAEPVSYPDYQVGYFSPVIMKETTNYYYHTTATYIKNVPSSDSFFADLKVGHQYNIVFDLELVPDTCIYKIFPAETNYPASPEFTFTGTNTMVTPDAQFTYPLVVGRNNLTFVMSSAGNIQFNIGVDVWLSAPVSMSGRTLRFWGSFKYILKNITVDDQTPLTDNEALNELVKGQNAQIEQSQQFHDEERSSAEQAGSDMGGFATQLENLKGTWAILWYPIEFTNTVMGVFTDGTSGASYRSIYSNVSGYTYDDSSGLLKPVYKSPIATIDAVDVPSGTGLTFPSFSIMGVKVWDSYTFDLAGLKDQFPVVFDSLYVIVSILEVLWFVGFLRSKYEEVFG